MTKSLFVFYVIFYSTQGHAQDQLDQTIPPPLPAPAVAQAPTNPPPPKFVPPPPPVPAAPPATNSQFNPPPSVGGNTGAPSLPGAGTDGLPQPVGAGAQIPAAPQLNPPPEVLGDETDPNLGASNAFSNDPAFMESEILSYLEPYIYDVEGRRDPFQPYQVFTNSILDEGQPPPVISQEDTRVPLQRYNLSQLKLKAILWNVKTPRIIIQDPTKALHTLVTNDRIGNNGGYVAKIREGEVVILQKMNVQGRFVTSTKLLRLKR